MISGDWFEVFFNWWHMTCSLRCTPPFDTSVYATWPRWLWGTQLQTVFVTRDLLKLASTVCSCVFLRILPFPLWFLCWALGLCWFQHYLWIFHFPPVCDLWLHSTVAGGDTSSPSHCIRTCLVAHRGLLGCVWLPRAVLWFSVFTGVWGLGPWTSIWTPHPLLDVDMTVVSPFSSADVRLAHQELPLGVRVVLCEGHVHVRAHHTAPAKPYCVWRQGHQLLGYLHRTHFPIFHSQLDSKVSLRDGGIVGSFFTPSC